MDTAQSLEIPRFSGIEMRTERVLATPRPALTSSGWNPPMAQTKLCSIEGCEKPRNHHLGYCSMHAWRYRTHGDPLKLLPPVQRPTECKIDGCSRAPRGAVLQLCSAHYQKLYKRGDAVAAPQRADHGAPREWLRANAGHGGDDCLIWPFARHTNGEAAIGDRQSRQAARLMCIMAHGDPPSPDMQAAHSCGKGHLACVNPRHLSWKTPKQNMEDKRRHGTHLEGERCPNAKLTEIQVRAIRDLAASFSVADLAEIFGVHGWTISNIIKRETWAWLK